MSAAPESQVAKIHRLMANGLTDDEIVTTLVEQGLSRPTAERFLARALETPMAPSPSGAPASAAGPKAASDDAPTMELFVGMGLLLVGAYLLANGARLGGKIMIGLVFGGAFAYARAMWRCLWHVRPLPWMAMSVASLPIVAALAWNLARPAQTSEDARFDAAEAAISAQRASDAKRAENDAARSTATRAAMDRHLATLNDTRNLIGQCDAALALGRSRQKTYVPALERVMYDGVHESVQICAAAGLVELGESEKMIAVYSNWARSSNSELARSAVRGFGAIGPAAASHALPYLAQWLRGDEVSRYLAVDTLTMLGAEARPLLEQASADPVAHIRERALDGLDPSRVQKRLANLPRPGDEAR